MQSLPKSGGPKARSLIPSVDFLNLLAYDFHGAWEEPPSNQRHHAQLFSTEQDRLSINSLVDQALNYGFAEAKVLVGLSTYGRSLRLSSLQSVVGPGIAARHTKMPGMISFFEICEMLRNESVDGLIKPPRSLTPVSLLDARQEWIGYDDLFSFSNKVTKLDLLTWLLELGGGYLLYRKP